MTEQAHAAKPAIRELPEAKAETRGAADSAGLDSRTALRLPSAEDRQANFRASVARRNDTGLPDRLKAGIESLSGFSMDDVRVHYGSSKPAGLGALAYAQGTDIHVGPGQERHLPHEAWHVVQQKQGRVRETARRKQASLNDDDELEREAEAMGAAAAKRLGPLPSILGSGKSTARTIQRKLVKLSEAEIERLIANYPSSDPNAPKPARPVEKPLFDTREEFAEYLQGLWVGADAAHGGRAGEAMDTAADQSGIGGGNAAGSQASSAPEDAMPTLYVRIAKVPKGLGARIALFARVEDLSAGEEEDANVWDRFAQNHAKLYDGNEKEYSVETVLSWLGSHEGTVSSVKNDLAASIMTGGEPDIGDPSGYGQIEFRFLKDNGYLYINHNSEGAEELVAVATKNKIDYQEEVADEVAYRAEMYRLCAFPYPAERATDDFVFVSSDLYGKFEDAAEKGIDPKLKAVASSAVTSAQPLKVGDPAGAEKKIETTYRRSPGRAGRGSGQAAVMGASAGTYARSCGVGAASPDWEWLHLRASSLGGQNHPRNLVAGTASANTQMIPYERKIYELARNATFAKPLTITWTCTLVSLGKPTHIGERITIGAHWPDGASPAETRQAAAIDKATVDVTQGAGFTKVDRDLVELRFGRAQKEDGE